MLPSMLLVVLLATGGAHDYMPLRDSPAAAPMQSAPKSVSLLPLPTAADTSWAQCEAVLECDRRGNLVVPGNIYAVNVALGFEVGIGGKYVASEWNLGQILSGLVGGLCATVLLLLLMILWLCKLTCCKCERAPNAPPPPCTPEPARISIITSERGQRPVSPLSMGTPVKAKLPESHDI